MPLNGRQVMRLSILQPVVVALLFSPGCERSLTFDAQGVAHGTGERVHSYKSGAVQLREGYVDGKLVLSRWFKPDGTLVQETKWNNGNGEAIHLREDGSIRTRMQYVAGVAEGEAREYDASGNVTKVVQYRGGQRVSESDPPATRPAA
jgi:antitoxin component YwqK of YwqJK toxin-antitoxin module